MGVEVVDEVGAGEDAALAEHALACGQAILACMDRSTNDVCLMLVGDEQMRKLNRDWRAKDAPTDVLSFSQIEGEAMPGDSAMLGDIVISVDTLRRQAIDGGWNNKEEMTRLVLHGVLHLLGYDHELPEDASVMRSEEARIVALLADRGVACAWEDASS